MTMGIRSTALVMMGITLSFLLGWSMRGDRIYGAMFESTVGTMSPGLTLPLKAIKK